MSEWILPTIQSHSGGDLLHGNAIVVANKEILCFFQKSLNTINHLSVLYIIRSVSMFIPWILWECSIYGYTVNQTSVRMRTPGHTSLQCSLAQYVWLWCSTYRLPSVVQPQYHYIVVFLSEKIVPESSQESKHSCAKLKFLSSGALIKRGGEHMRAHALYTSAGRNRMRKILPLSEIKTLTVKSVPNNEILLIH